MAVNFKLLDKLISIKSSFPMEKEIGNYLSDYLKNLDFKVKKEYISKNRFNIFASRGEEKASILFYGHLDTVPTDISYWKTDPYRSKKIGNKVFGLGAYDMKGGIVAFLSAVEKVKTNIKIFLSVDEENVSEGAWLAVKEEKGFFKDVDLVISAEPNFGMGIYNLTTGRTGRCVYTVHFIGKKAHLAEYQKGIDAIKAASDFISEFYQKRNKLFKSIKTVAVIRKIDAEAIGMSVCGEAIVDVDVLIDKPDTIKSIQKTIQSLTKAEVEIKERKTPYLEGYKFTDFLFSEIIGKIIKKNTGQKMILSNRSSVADDNILATLGSPVITWGPSGGNAHESNEFVELDSLELLSQMYKELLEAI